MVIKAIRAQVVIVIYGDILLEMFTLVIFPMAIMKDVVDVAVPVILKRKRIKAENHSDRI